MPITNDPTGRVSTCAHCDKKVEEARLMKGIRSRTVDVAGRLVTTTSHGILVWRTVDRGHGSAVCPDVESGRHEPTRITYRSVHAPAEPETPDDEDPDGGAAA
ncbi:hypothetical protein [Cellulosimicrobium sp. NPDC057862]|uniref:hypothetical protein n=1 Tax=Actinomycetes TaxID=1760 RepID=UPI00366B961C